MKAHIIIINDDDATRQMLTRSLEDNGYRVSNSDYASINLLTLQHQLPDLIIIDFNLGHDAIEWQFLQLLKMEDTTASIPILITATALQLSAEIQNYLLTRYISVVYKPYDLELLLVLIQKTLVNASQAGVIFTSDHILPILVVDDTEDLLDSMMTILMLEGYQVVTANNGMVALDAVSRAEHCLILLDIAMPIMNGFEFLTAYERQLRPHSPVVIVSGEPNIRTQKLPTFVVDVVPKPYQIRSLLDVVDKYALQA